MRPGREVQDLRTSVSFSDVSLVRLDGIGKGCLDGCHSMYQWFRLMLFHLSTRVPKGPFWSSLAYLQEEISTSKKQDLLCARLRG